MIKQLLLVGLGGGLGSIFRYLTSVLTAKHYTYPFPLATFAANILGCFLIGLLIGKLGDSIDTSQNLRLLLLTGFCGGYTTFSTFSSENLYLLQTQNYILLAGYVLASVLVGLFAVWLGIVLSR